MSPVTAQFMDSFEGGEPRWQLVESDCQAQLTMQEISLVMPHGGQTSELLEVACAAGSQALLAYPIEPCAVLDEFQPQIWTRCSSSRIRVGVRVLFPLESHPVTGGRLTTILWGEAYSEAGQWQVLRVPSMQKLLNDEIIGLRQRFGPQLKLDGGYVDCVVVNAYTGPGRFRLQLDDLDLNGLIPLASFGVPTPANWRTRWRWRENVPSAEQRFWASPNRIPVWFQYQGESLPWLRSLGMTGVLLGQLASEDRLRDVHDAGLAVICPPPQHNVVFQENTAAAIKGWLVGAALDARQTQFVLDQAHRAAALDPSLKRPLVGEALEHYWQYTRIADEVIVPLPESTAAGTWRAKQKWAAEKLALVQNRGQGWASIQVDLGLAIEEQYRAARRVTDGNDPNRAEFAQGAQPAPIADPVGLRHKAVGAIVSGARGVLFRTSKPLSIQQPAERAQVAALRWVNNDFTLWGPWIVAGQFETPPAVSQAEYLAAAWTVLDSHLVIAQANADGCQYCVPSTAGRPLQLKLPTSSAAMQVLRLTLGRPEPMRVAVTPSALQWTVDKPLPVESFVITSNPQVLEFVRRHLADVAESNAADQLEVAGYCLSVASQLVDARYAAGESEEQRLAAATPDLIRLAEAQRQLEQGRQAHRSRQFHGASLLAHSASDSIQQVLSEAQKIAVENLSTAQSSPFVVSPPTLFLHWRMADACARSTWRSVPLPGGQFTDLTHMLEHGWSQQRRLEERVDLRVELVPRNDSPHGALRLAAYQKPNSESAQGQVVEGGYEGASLRVRSAAVEVEPGQLVRVAAVARVLHATQRPDSGLLVYDNQAGPSLGQLVQGQAGARIPVELYRIMVSGNEFRLLAECRGECDILLEDIQFSAINPAHNHRGFVTSPLMTTHQ